jgi:hypothetical protein
VKGVLPHHDSTATLDAGDTNVQGFDVPNTIGPLGGPHFELGWIS